MGEHRRGREAKKLVSATIWTRRNSLPTVDWRSKLDLISYLHSNDRSSRNRQYHFLDKRFTSDITIIFVSAAACGTGLGEVFAGILGVW